MKNLPTNLTDTLRFTGKENCLQFQWDFDIMGLQACRNVSVRCKWEMSDERRSIMKQTKKKIVWLRVCPEKFEGIEFSEGRYEYR
jgi:hypothetical protein